MSDNIHAPYFPPTLFMNPLAAADAAVAIAAIGGAGYTAVAGYTTSSAAALGWATVHSGAQSNWGVPQAQRFTLTLKDAKDLMEQYDDDGILVKDSVLLFGVHAAKKLQEIPLEYFVELSQALRTLRRAMLLEIRRRRVSARLTRK